MMSHVYWECRVNRLFVSMMSRVLIGSGFKIIYQSPLCHADSLECLVNCLFFSMLSQVYWECLVNRLFVSIMSCVLIEWVLPSVYISLLYHRYSLEV